MIDRRRRKLECLAVKQRQNLLGRSPNRGCGADDLRLAPAGGEHKVERCLIDSRDCPERPEIK